MLTNYNSEGGKYYQTFRLRFMEVRLWQEFVDNPYADDTAVFSKARSMLTKALQVI